MKQIIQNAQLILSSAIIGYLLNCYYYNTFNPVQFAIESKIASTVILLIVFIVYHTIRESYKFDTDKIDALKNCKHDWQKTSKYTEECLICKATRANPNNLI